MPCRGREREKKRRQRRSDSEDDGVFTGWKLGLVVGVIVICFAMLYPTIIHPLLMGFVGRREPPKPVTPSRPPIHPGMGGPGVPRPGGPGRPDIHPAMRMAQQQAESQSSGRGMFTWMLPLYTVGVVVFLLYTLFKTKNRKKKRSRYDDSSDYSSDDADEYNSRLKKKLGKRKLRNLQERLQQTEEAMTKILEQLEAVQAAGALVAGEQNALLEAESKEKPEEKKVEVSAKNDQYIHDLEKALKDFKVLSEAYEDEKKHRHRRNSQTEEDETSSGELQSESDSLSEEDEEEEGYEEKEEKSRKSSVESEDASENEKEQIKKEQRRKRKGGRSESPAPVESVIELSESKKSTKNLRRRAKKI